MSEQIDNPGDYTFGQKIAIIMMALFEKHRDVFLQLDGIQEDQQHPITVNTLDDILTEVGQTRERLNTMYEEELKKDPSHVEPEDLAVPLTELDGLRLELMKIKAQCERPAPHTSR